MARELQEAFRENPAFQSIAHEVADRRQRQKVKWSYTYSTGTRDEDGVDNPLVGGTSRAFIIQIEQGTDFWWAHSTGSAFGFSTENDTDFPIPNSLDDGGGAPRQDWAMRGLQIKMTDTRTNRELTSAFVNFENLFTPGFGINFQMPMPAKHLLLRTSKLRIDARYNDNANRSISFQVVLHGMKYLVPAQG